MILIATLVLLSSFLVIATGNGNSNNSENQNNSIDSNQETEQEQNQGEIQNQEQNQNMLQDSDIIKEQNQLRIHSGNQSCPPNCSCSGSTTKCGFENGSRIMTIYAGKSGNIIVQVKDINASTNVTLYKADGKVYGVFENNKTHEIILPDEVKDRIRNKTKAHLENESITLDENGKYQIQAKKQAKLLWMFNVKEKSQFTVDAETGEITKSKNSWWGFLAKDVEE